MPFSDRRYGIFTDNSIQSLTVIIFSNTSLFSLEHCLFAAFTQQQMNWMDLDCCLLYPDMTKRGGCTRMANATTELLTVIVFVMYAILGTWISLRDIKEEAERK